MIGIPLYALAGRTIIKGFPTGRLLTKGVYRVCRHPVYGSWIVFIIPGVGLVLHSWLAVSTSVFGYMMLRVMAREEEAYLGQEFGEDYARYRRGTPFVLPIGFLSRRETISPRSETRVT